jgi:nucleoid-associated protein YgaU
MASSIGIKIANGEFYSIIDENSTAKKRLILTTVHDNQKSVQIDLYKSAAATMADALYIGSLVVENIRPRPKGEPSVELVIASTADGKISADATDLDTSVNAAHQHLSVSLTSFDEDKRDKDFPDFELEQNEPPPQGLYEKAVKKQQAKKNPPWTLIILIGVVLVLICFALWFFLFSGNAKSGNADPQTTVIPQVTAQPVTPQTPVQPAQPVQATQPAQPAAEPAQPVQPVAAAPTAPPPVIEAPAVAAPTRTYARNRPVPPVVSFKVPATIPSNGVPYKIAWGDTLWDISEAFYRNPWLYTRIARFNNIRNPDHIISGTTIRVPPKN